MKKVIYLAGGCFWGVEAYFQLLKGVIDTDSGYANGNFTNPSYEDLCAKRATHVEAVRVAYDDEKISLVKILEHLFRIIDPFSVNRQGGDRGIQYRSGIYYEDEADEMIIKEFIASEQKKHLQKIMVETVKLQHFFKAEEYHQDYLIKNPSGYCHVNFNLIKDEERKK